MSEKTDNSYTESDLVAPGYEIVEAGSADSREGVISVLIYDIGGSALAINVDQTEGVVDCPRVTPLPNALEGIIGVASIRGRMTLVMDLSAGAERRSTKQRLVLVKGEKQLGLLADRVEGVVSLRKITQKTNSSRSKSTSAKETPEGIQVASPRSFFMNGDNRIPIIDAEQLAAAD